MASIRKRVRKDGTVAYNVMYVIDGRQTSATFDTDKVAKSFRDNVHALGARRAMDMWGIPDTVKVQEQATVKAWVQHHIDHLTGVQPATVHKYRAYLRNDIEPHLGDIPLDKLSRDDIKAWIGVLEETAKSGKTIKNKANFLSGCLNSAIAEDKIARNPFLGVRLPEWHRKEKTFLTRAEFDIVLESVTEYWRPLVKFLVASGARFGEAVALRPADIDADAGEVRIWKSWKIVPGGYELGTPKSKKSVRTVNVPSNILQNLNPDGAFVFENRDGGPVRIHGFQERVWQPARARAKAAGLTKQPRVHDLRHTAASWMIQDGANFAAIQAMLGHESITTTLDTYGSLDRRAAQELSDLMAKRLS